MYQTLVDLPKFVNFSFEWHIKISEPGQVERRISDEFLCNCREMEEDFTLFKKFHHPLISLLRFFSFLFSCKIR